MWNAILIILYSGWSLLVLCFLSLPVLLPILWWLYWVLQLELVSPSPSCSCASSAVFQFYFVVSRDCQIHNSARSVFIIIIIARSDRLAEIRCSICISKSLKSLFASFSKTDSGLYIYYLLVWSDVNFLHNSQWITFPIQSYLVLDSFYADLLHSLFLGVFHASASWWSFTRVWITASIFCSAQYSGRS